MPKRRAFEISPLPFEVSVALEALGQRIALARKERKQSQRVFADILGLALPPWLPSNGAHPMCRLGTMLEHYGYWKSKTHFPRQFWATRNQGHG